MACPIVGTRVRRTDDRQIRLKVRLSDSQESTTVSSPIKFVASGQCPGWEDYTEI